MRRYFFELLALALLLGSLVFFGLSVAALTRHDYVAGLLLSGIGFAVIQVGVELARLALAERA